MKGEYAMAALLVFFTTISSAQKNASTKSKKDSVVSLFDHLTTEEKINKSEELRKGSFTPFGGSGLSNIISNISVVSTFNEGQNAKAELKFSKNDWSAFGITIDQKITKGTSIATPIDLINGLSSGTKVGFNIQHGSWNAKLKNQDRKKLNTLLNQYAKRTKKERASLNDEDIQKNGTIRERIRLRKISMRSPVFFNVQAFMEKTSFTYATDSIKLTSIESNYITPSVIGSLMIPKIHSNSFWILNYSFSQNYNAGSDITLSQPFGTTKNYVNQSVTFGEPTKATSNKLSVEWRKGFINRDGKLSFVIDPSVLLNFAKNRLTVTCPVYLIPGQVDKAKIAGLQGGFLLGWSSGGSFSDNFGAQLFVSAPFDIFKEVK